MKRFVKSLVLIFVILAAFTSVACKISVNSKDPVTYKVTYQTERETAPAAIKVKKNTVLTESQLPALTSKGYTFLGWYDSEIKAEPGQYKVIKDVTLIAKWKVVQNTATTYTVKFNSMGGNDIPDQTVTSGQKATKPDNPTKADSETDHYIFDNWYTSTDGGSTLSTIPFDFNTTITSNLTLYAKWDIIRGFKIPLTFEFINSGTITITNPWSTLKYSKNGGALLDYPGGEISAGDGDKICLYAERSENLSETMTIGCSSECYIYGNVMSLVTLNPQTGEWNPYKALVSLDAFRELFCDNTYIRNHEEKKLYLPATKVADYCYYGMFSGCTNLTTPPDLPATTIANYCYSYMFYGCTSLTTAPALPATELKHSCYNGMFCGCTSLTTAPTLPATELEHSCYNGMFSGCTSLSTAPALPATKLGYSCYSFMFSDCTNLTTAPTLPATTLVDYCYCLMFENCKSLTTAPKLPATTLAESCYDRMFNGCTNLNHIECLATDKTAANCTLEWLVGVSSTGTFIKNKDMTDWTTGSSGIPSGWTVQDAE